MQGELEYFRSDNVRVTSARFVVGEKTYDMSEIIAVKKVAEQPMIGPLILFIAGCYGLTIDEMWTFVAGLTSIMLALFWFIKGANYIVVLSTSAGESREIVGQNNELVSKIIKALNTAIIRKVAATRDSQIGD